MAAVLGSSGIRPLLDLSGRLRYWGLRMPARQGADTISLRHCRRPEVKLSEDGCDLRGASRPLDSKPGLSFASGCLGRCREGFLSGPYDPRTNRHCTNADVLARLLNEVLKRRENWLPDLLQTEDAMRQWEASTPAN